MTPFQKFRTPAYLWSSTLNLLHSLSMASLRQQTKINSKRGVVWITWRHY